MCVCVCIQNVCVCVYPKFLSKNVKRETRARILSMLNYFTWIRPAFSLVITFSMAAGINMSHGSYIRFSPSYNLAPGKPTMVPFSMRYSSNSWNVESITIDKQFFPSFFLICKNSNNHSNQKSASCHFYLWIYTFWIINGSIVFNHAYASRTRTV